LPAAQSPLEPERSSAGSFISFLALAHYHQENYEEAVHHGELAVSARRLYLGVRVLLATLGQVGRVEEARPSLEEFMLRYAEDPQRQFEITTPYLDLKYHEHYLDGLCRAGASNLV
jgi:adenylate cyclase